MAERKTIKASTTKPVRDGSVQRVSSKNGPSRDVSKERGISNDRSKNASSSKNADSNLNQTVSSRARPTISEPTKLRSTSTSRELVSKDKPARTTASTRSSVVSTSKLSETSSPRIKESQALRSTVPKSGTSGKVPSKPRAVKPGDTGSKNGPVKAVHSERTVTGSKTIVRKSVQEQPVKKETVKDIAQQDRNKYRTSHRERTRTRTLSPSESMLLSKLSSVVSPDVSNSQTQNKEENVKKVVQPDENDDDNYDDDFEDYESDFEDATESKADSHREESHSESETEDFSSDLSELKNSDQNTTSDFISKTVTEESKLDSGHYDVASRSNQGTKANNEDIFNDLATMKDIKTPTSSGDFVNTDEGFVDDKQFVIRQNIIDFSQARKVHQNKMVASSLNERARTLLQMIRLDSQSFSLYDEAPVPYEVYMRIYGQKNTLQSYSQTGEEMLSEETQTDNIVPKNKWTQHPPNHSTSGGQILKLSQLASGSDPVDDADFNQWNQKIKVDLNQLEQFIMKTGQVVLLLLEESNEETEGKLRSNKMDLGFSSGFIAVGVDSVPFIAQRLVSHLSFIPQKTSHLLSVHRSAPATKQAEKEYNETNDCLRRCIICLWNLRSPATPIRLLVSSADVASLCVHPSSSSLIFCGLDDGVVCAWDLRERHTYHKNVTYREKNWVLQPATYSTADKRGEKGHISQVVGIQALEPNRDDALNEGEVKPTQVVSVEASGHLIVWTVLRASSGNAGKVDDLGLAFWGNIRLVHSAFFNIRESFTSLGDEIHRANLQCTSLESDGWASHIYVTTNTGSVAHYVVAGKAWPPVYRSAWDNFVPATCISHCPFGEDYFLVGNDEGSVRVYKCGRERPLLTVAGTGEPPGCGAAIRALQWSRSRPCVFFALDVASRLHVWDLGVSDMYPIISVPFKGKVISALCLSPHAKNKQNAYLVLGTSCGRIKAHQLTSQLGNPSPNQVAQELDKFVRYVSIL